MKPAILPTTALLLTALTSTAENARYVTVTGQRNSTQVGVIQIQQGETAEVVTCQHDGGSTCSCNVLKDGLSFPGYGPGYGTFSGGTFPRGMIVTGPGTITTITNFSYASILTVKITPAAYDVSKTVMIAPGTNQFYVTLESSTNLIFWADATNAAYGSPDTARFFRIRMDNLSSP